MQGARWCLGTVTIVGIAACSPTPEPVHQTVEYYRANREVREARVAECANDPGTLGKTADCVNAKQAAQIEGIGNFGDLPPMGLLKDAGKADPPGKSSQDQGTGSPPRDAK